MLAPYARVLGIPGALKFSSAGVLARLPISMVSLSIVLMVSALYHEYGLAGRITATFAVAQALCAPQLAKLVDSYGQARVMRPSLTLALVSLAGMVVAANLDAHPAWLYLTAAGTGATTGSMGALVRARWAAVLPDRRDLHTAYSFESVLDELVFVVGPVLATALATGVSPTAGLVLAVVAAGVGGFWLLSQRETEPRPRPRSEGQPRGSVLRSPAMLTVVGVFLALGVIFGASDVSTVAFAGAHGARAWAGVMLAVMAAGSLLAGLGYGLRHWVRPLWQRFVIGVVALALGVSCFVLVTNLVVLAVVMFVTGLAIAPSIINGSALVQQLVPAHRLTEGLAWMSTSIGVGFATGTALAGTVVDVYGPRGGYTVVMAAGFTAAAVALVAMGTLRAEAARSTRADDGGA